MTELKEILKTFEDACKIQDLDPNKVLPDFSCFPEGHREAMIAQAKLIIIVESANMLANNGEKWSPDWSDRDQYKYEPWFSMDDGSSPFGFSYLGYDSWITVTSVGSRLCFISREVIEYVANQFIDLYRDFYVIK